MASKVKRLSSSTKDVNVLRAEYEERKKKRSEKNVDNILKSMNKLVNPECGSDSEAPSKPNGVVSNIPPTVKTLSIAVPASILDNAQSAELRTYLGGQIARAACIFKVDEQIEIRKHLEHGEA